MSRAATSFMVCAIAASLGLFIVAGPAVRSDNVRRFGEIDCAAGILGQLRGPDLMPVLLNAADRPLYLGSRPTPYDGADGYPEVLEPFMW